MLRSMRSWSCNRDFTYSGYRLSQVKEIISNLGYHYIICKETSPRQQDFEPCDLSRVAYTEFADDTYFIFVSELQ